MFVLAFLFYSFFPVGDVTVVAQQRDRLSKSTLLAHIEIVPDRLLIGKDSLEFCIVEGVTLENPFGNAILFLSLFTIVLSAVRCPPNEQETVSDLRPDWKSIGKHRLVFICLVQEKKLKFQTSPSSM